MQMHMHAAEMSRAEQAYLGGQHHLISPPFAGVVAAHTQAAASYTASAHPYAGPHAEPHAAPHAYPHEQREASSYNPCASGLTSNIGAMSLGPP